MLNTLVHQHILQLECVVQQHVWQHGFCKMKGALVTILCFSSRLCSLSLFCVMMSMNVEFYSAWGATTPTQSSKYSTCVQQHVWQHGFCKMKGTLVTISNMFGSMGFARWRAPWRPSATCLAAWVLQDEGRLGLCKHTYLRILSLQQPDWQDVTFQENAMGVFHSAWTRLLLTTCVQQHVWQHGFCKMKGTLVTIFCFSSRLCSLSLFCIMMSMNVEASGALLATHA